MDRAGRIVEFHPVPPPAVLGQCPDDTTRRDDTIHDPHYVGPGDPAVLSAVCAGHADIVRSDQESAVRADLLDPLDVTVFAMSKHHDRAERRLELHVDVDVGASMPDTWVTKRDIDGLMDSWLHRTAADLRIVDLFGSEGGEREDEDEEEH